MGWFRSNGASWAVRLALVALFLRALAPVGQAAALGGEHGGSLQALAVCNAFTAKQTTNGAGDPVKHGGLNDCAMCMANPVAAAVVLATVAAVVVAPGLSAETIEVTPQDLAVFTFAPKADAARAPPALQTL